MGGTSVPPRRTKHVTSRFLLDDVRYTDDMADFYWLETIRDLEYSGSGNMLENGMG